MIGMIGGSALYDMEDLEIIERRKVETPFGDPSDAFEIGKLCGRDVAFLPRLYRVRLFYALKKFTFSLDFFPKCIIFDLFGIKEIAA